MSGVILAAGSSRRLGRPKQLLDLGGEPLLRHTVRNALAAGLDEVILVLGSHADEVATAVGDLGQRTVVNPAFAAGQSTSLVAGIATVSRDAGAALMLLGDQPMVTTSAIDRVIDKFHVTSGIITQATYDGVPGTPVLFARPLFGELLNVTGDEGARSIVRRHRDAVWLLEIGDVADVLDIDTGADYQRLLDRWMGRRKGNAD